ncbi:transcription factor Spt20p [Monosporozyma unispora]|nr:Transcription factor spt20 [Kazachstania unispora]
MNNNNAGVGIPVNVGGSTAVNTGVHGGPVNVPKNVNSANSTPTMRNTHINTSNNNIPNNIHNNNVNGNGHHASPAEIQQRQRILMQQRALQQQQAMQNFENQFFQLLMTLNKKPKRLYNFVEDTDSILHKYEQYRPSFEFHIYENNYKICAPANSRLQQQNTGADKSSNVMHNDGLILNKNNETLKEFLEYVARGRIPEAIMEVLRDSNIQFYESNLILQVYDHTNTVEVVVNKPVDKVPNAQPPNVSTTNATSSAQIASPNNKPATPNMKSTETNTQTGSKPSEQSKTFKRPRVYRTLLRPNDLTNYYDMMTYADQARFSDSIYQQFESEILTLTKRNVKLDVTLNPYENREKIDNDEFVEPEYNEETKSMVFAHREESSADNTKGKVGHIAEHEELPQNTSNYEQLMLVMNERTTTTTNSTFATALAQYSMNLNGSGNNNGLNSSRNSSISLSSVTGSSSSGNKSNSQTASIANAAAAAVAAVGSSNDNNQFNRLKFIEQWKVNREKRKQQMALNNTGNGSSNGSSLPGTPFSTKISMTVPMTPQKQFLQQQQQLMQANEKKNSTKGNKRANGDKQKPKRPRKNKKNADGTQQTPKRKRVTKKKAGATASTANTSTAGSPSSQSPASMNTPL